MNLAEYEKLDTGTSKGDFISFEKTGDTKYLRFLYTSGGEKMGEDISIRRKKWDDVAHKYVYDTDDGTLTAVLEAIEYDVDGKNPRRVRWERSAYFCKNTLLPMFRNYPRIIDGVWKISASNPRTKDATYALFPVLDADTVKFPIIEDEKEVKEATSTSEKEVKEEVKAAPRKKYWE